MKDFLVRIFIIIPLISGGCSPESRHDAATATAAPVEVETTYEPPRPTVVKEEGYKIARGATKLKDIQAKYDEETRSMRLSGAIEYLPAQGGGYQNIKVDLVGLLNNGFIVMKPEPGSEIDEKVRVAAKATCLSEEGTCSSSFIDIYLYTDGIVYHHQVETKEPKKEVKPDNKDDKKDSVKTDKPAKSPKSPEEAVDNAPARPTPTPKPSPSPEGERLRRPEKDDVIVNTDDYDKYGDEEHDDHGEDGHDDESEEEGRYVGTIGEDIEQILKVKPELEPAQSKEERDERADKKKDDTEIENVPVPLPRPDHKADDKKEDPKKDQPKKEDPKKDPPKKEEPKKEEPKKEEPKKDEPKKDEPKKDNAANVEKPKVAATQSIGSVNSGRLENAVNMFTWEKENSPTGFHVIRSFRKTHFATNEMAYILRIIGKMTLNLVPNYVVPVGDISLEKGGTIFNDEGKPRHKSHKSGRDADVGYYYEDKSLMTNLFSAVHNKKSWMPEQQWQLFKSIVRTQYIDRIFVHPALKRELCDIAIKKGDIDKNAKSGVAFETLRRLIPDSGHDTHFHVRVKCSKAQYACKQMVDPEAKTGCF